MKKTFQFLFFFTIILIADSLHSQEKVYDFSKLEEPYFGQKAPIDKAEVFMNGIISTKSEPEMCAAFTYNGKEFYFNKKYNGNWAIFFTKMVNGFWTKPEPLPFTSDFTDRDFTISPDGKRFFLAQIDPKKKGNRYSNRKGSIQTMVKATKRWISYKYGWWRKLPICCSK